MKTLPIELDTRLGTRISRFFREWLAERVPILWFSALTVFGVGKPTGAYSRRLELTFDRVRRREIPLIGEYPW
jgi:hypothetical protein